MIRISMVLARAADSRASAILMRCGASLGRPDGSHGDAIAQREWLQIGQKPKHQLDKPDLPEHRVFFVNRAAAPPHLLWKRATKLVLIGIIGDIGEHRTPAFAGTPWQAEVAII
jgi:hypothetical protein